MDGIIVVKKETGMTSHDVVNRLRKILGTKKVGHCGTLDPEASGVLVCCVNKATKIIQFLTAEEKEYIATLYLGASTTTYDKEGEIVEKKEYIDNFSHQYLQDICNGFLGKSLQIPPIYSAIKVNGKKLYEYAREGIEVEIQPREIEIKEIEVLDVQDNLITFRAKCSKGTYIRSLCLDIANRLGYPGYMQDLVRTQSGPFTLDDSFSLEQISNNDYILHPIEQGLTEYKSVVMDNEQEILQGKKLRLDYNERIVIINKNNKALAIYEPCGDGLMRSVRGLW